MYQHQTHTCYVLYNDDTPFPALDISYAEENGDREQELGTHIASHARFGAIRKLQIPQWANDGVVDGKYVRQIGFQRYNCQRARRREKDENKDARKNTMKTNCPCYIVITYHQVFEDELCSEGSEHGPIKIIFSDSRSDLQCKGHHHHDHDLSWMNRNAAPWPQLVLEKFESIIIDNPSFVASIDALQRWIDRSDGFRSDMFELTGFRPSLNDSSLYVTANPNRARYIHYKFIGYFCNKSQSDQDEFMRHRDEMMRDPEQYDKTDLFFIQPYKRLLDGDQPDNSQFEVVDIIDPKDPNKRLRYQPFVSIYQNKNMRKSLHTFGTKIVSLDSTFGTVKYGFKMSAGSVLDELRIIEPAFIIFVQHETKRNLASCLTMIREHMHKHGQKFKPVAIIMDKCDTEAGAVELWDPEVLKWLCVVHNQRIWHRKLPSFLGKKNSYVVQRAMETMLYVRSEERMLETETKLQNCFLLKTNNELATYLKKHWLNIKKRWCLCYRTKYHNEVDTTNMSESMFHSLKSKLKLAPNRKIVTTFKFVLTKLNDVNRRVALCRYKKSKHWKSTNSSLFKDLDPVEYENRPDRIVSMLREHKNASKSINKTQIEKTGDMFIISKSNRNKTIRATLSLVEGHCSCHDFNHKGVPCDHMYAVMRHYKLTWSTLPKHVTDAAHMKILDAHTSNHNVPPARACAVENVELDGDVTTSHAQLPHVETQNTINERFKQSLVGKAQLCLNLCHAMENKQVESFVGAPDEENPIWFMEKAHALLLAKKDTDKDGLWKTESGARHRRTSKRHCFQAREQLELDEDIFSEPALKKQRVLPNVPHTPASAATKRVLAVRRGKRERKKLLQPVNVFDTAEVFKEKVNLRNTKLEQRKAKAAQQHRDKMQLIPKHMRIDNTDVNVDSVDGKPVRRSKRIKDKNDKKRKG